MFLGPLNHVGIAVPDIEQAVARYRDIFDVEDISDEILLPKQGVRVVFVNLPSGQVELIEPLGQGSPILKFLEKNPKGGQHHICFEVDDIFAAVKKMEDKGVRVLGAPRMGAHGTDVVFLHPSDMGGVLIELMQSPKTQTLGGQTSGKDH